MLDCILFFRPDPKVNSLKMGRWGYRVFEGDTDLDTASYIESDVGFPLHEDDPVKIKECREKLDAGLGADLLAKHRALESEKMSDRGIYSPKYDTILVAAYMMHFGAKIPDDDLEHMRKTVLELESRSGYVWPLGEVEFRDAGKVQMIAALNHYQAGKPRLFMEPSCFNCGKMSCDIGGMKLKQCAGCKEGKVTWYCDRECQKANWAKHKKHICGGHRNNGRFTMLNV